MIAWAIVIAALVVCVVALRWLYRPGPIAPATLPRMAIEELTKVDAVLECDLPLGPGFFAARTVRRKAFTGLRECLVLERSSATLLLTYGEAKIAYHAICWLYAGFTDTTAMAALALAIAELEDRR